MSIKRYLPGEHKSGFSGWRVVVVIDGKRYQHDFSDQPPSLVSEKLWCEYQSLNARVIELQLQKRLAVRQYFNFIRSDDPRINPERRVGVRGISAEIVYKAGKWRCGFKVSLGQQSSPKFFEISDDRLFSETWQNAIDFWGEAYGIRTIDCQRKKQILPTTDIFKQLRRIMNEKGKDIPVSVLGPVYAEQREHIAEKKVTKKPAVDINESDIMHWFQRETGNKVA